MSSDLWQRYREHLLDCPSLGLRLDPSRMRFAEGFFETLAPKMARAFSDMEALERGAIANPDENRRVGHYWLRAPWLAPTAEITRAIEETNLAVEDFAAKVLGGLLRAPGGARFSDLLVIGIGGSALGPQLVIDALAEPQPPGLTSHFFDNTDPDGMQRVLDRLGARLATTLVLVVSKSGGTAETRNGMVVAAAALEARGLSLAPQAVAITGVRSALDRRAEAEGWLARFPMWDWVGGRTSVTSAVGLLPAALAGVDVGGLLAGAAACDEATRVADARANPAAMLAAMWFHATGGRGAKDMVVLPYLDRLLLFGRYLQQLVMESLGKGEDRAGKAVAQGIAVYGNKGSTDQHAYVQQLRDGVDNFFVTFIHALADRPAPGDDDEDADSGDTDGDDGEEDRHAAAVEVEPGITSGDYLRGFWLGTRAALAERGRESLTVTVERLDAWALGVLIALFERAVGLYASLIDVNAYHQPGVEAGKKAAAAALAVQGQALEQLAAATAPASAEEIASAIGAPSETVFHLLEGLAASGRGVVREAGTEATEARYRIDGEAP